MGELADFTERYQTVRLWMEHLRSPTREYFPRILRWFCTWAGKDPDELIRERRKQSQSADTEARYSAERLVERYLTELESERAKKKATSRRTLSPSYIRLQASAIRSFYHYNRADLYLIKRLEFYRVRDLDAASKDQIRAMHQVADPRERALLLFQYQSGLRNDTIAKLTLGDLESLNPDQAPVAIRIEPEKAKRRPSHYRSFLGKEALEALNVYLEMRRKGEVFRGAEPEELTPSSPVFREIARGAIRPITSVAISKVIGRLAKRAGFSNLTAHSLRRSFQTILESSGVSPNWIKLMMGHTLPGVEGAYSKPSVEQLREAYIKAEPNLSIIQPKPVLTSTDIEALVDKRVEERLKKIETRRAEADELMNWLLEDPEVRKLLARKIKELGLAES